MKQPKSIQVQVDTYTSNYKRLSKDLFYMERYIHRKDKDVQIDVFGRCWSFSIASNKSEQVRVLRKGRLISLNGPLGIFLPPFSIVEWHVHPGIVHYETLFASVDPPSYFPKEPVVFNSDTTVLPSSIAEICERMQVERDYVEIGREEKLSALALKARKWINQTYDQDVQIADIAEKLHCSHAVMTRAFKTAYGISPVKYRSRLRVTDSLRLMLLDQYSIPSAAHNVGFEDLSQFNKQFRRETKAVPSQFLER